MNLNKENLKKIRGLIVFTVILLIALWNYSLILDVLGQGVGIVYPFLLGGAIAFVINVPMSFFEEKLFQNQMMKNKKVAQRLARPVSLIITLIVVVSVIGLVVFGVLPKLGDTFISIGKGIQSLRASQERGGCRRGDDGRSGAFHAAYVPDPRGGGRMPRRGGDRPDARAQLRPLRRHEHTACQRGEPCARASDLAGAARAC